MEFWTFGCSNCLNTLPAIKSLNARYKDKGLTVVGIETPELDNEKSFANLQNAVKQAGIEYPILTDYDNANWNAYGVNAWPTVFILDQQGRIRYKHVGEGAYDTQEKVVAALLANAGGSDDEFDGKEITENRRRVEKGARPQGLQGPASGGHRVSIHRRVLGQSRGRDVLLPCLPPEGLYLRYEI